MVAVDLLRQAVVVEVHGELFGGVKQFAGGKIVVAVGVDGGNIADHLILQLHHHLVAFHHHGVARHAAPRLQPDLLRRLVIRQRGGFHLHRLGVLPRRIPVDLDLVFHQQLVGRGIVGGARRLAVALFEHKAGRLFGIHPPGVAVAGQAGSLNHGRLPRRLPFHRQIERDLDIAFGIQSLFVGIEGGRGALHQVVSRAVLPVDLHGDGLEIHPRSVLHLLHALGVDVGFDAAGGQVFVAILPVLRGSAQVLRQGIGRSRDAARQ